MNEYSYFGIQHYLPLWSEAKEKTKIWKWEEEVMWKTWEGQNPSEQCGSKDIFFLLYSSFCSRTVTIPRWATLIKITSLKSNSFLIKTFTYIQKNRKFSRTLAGRLSLGRFPNHICKLKKWGLLLQDEERLFTKPCKGEDWGDIQIAYKGRYFSLWGQWGTGTGHPEKLWVPHPWEGQAGWGFGQPGRLPCRGLGLDGL